MTIASIRASALRSAFGGEPLTLEHDPVAAPWLRRRALLTGAGVWRS